MAPYDDDGYHRLAWPEKACEVMNEGRAEGSPEELNRQVRAIWDR